MKKGKSKLPLGAIAAVAVVAGVGLGFTFQSPSSTYVQRGYRGVAQELDYHDSTVAAQRAANIVPAPEPAQDPAGQPSSGVYQNVKVLGNVDASEFLRLMSAITAWVAPVQGCTYCHSQENLAYDTVYTKIVARRMMEMTQHINADWKQHVGATGVTCYTCHRGNPVPRNIWFNQGPTAPDVVGGMVEANIGKNLATPVSVAGGSSLPSDPFTPFLEGSYDIREIATQALPGTDYHSIKETDWTYSLMIHFSNSLGVNCTYCHNSRAFYDWNQSSPQRVTAWYGIRMVRDINNNYLDPLGKNGTFPKGRLGEMGDAAKVNCNTCHQGIYKPLFGVSMVKDYPEIGAHGQVNVTADIGKVGDYSDKK
jgi:photosynthetic reaction center cytochrome c subunit